MLEVIAQEEGPRSHRRLVSVTGDGAASAYAYELGLPALDPDVTFVDADALSHGEKVPLRKVASFAEIKPAVKNDTWDPKPSRSDRTTKNMVKPIVKQTGEYCAWLFAGRPFQVFIIFVCIFGLKFRVGVCDRGGMTFSRHYDIDDETPGGGLEVFIRVHRRITCEMSEFDLGQDPLVHLAADQTHQQQEWPSFTIRWGNPTIKPITTQGPPMWTTMSILGRGTHVWRVQGGGVVKVAWRNIRRKSETEIYKKMPDIKGITKLQQGGDVMVEGKRLSINFLRKERGTPESKLTFCLHRVLVTPVGKPLWMFDTPLEFLYGVLDALRGEISESNLISVCQS
jgi:hypothetical protein